MKRSLVVTATVLTLLGAAAPAGAAPARSVPAHPAGWRTLRWHGEAFAVPASWAVRDLTADPSTCVRLDRHAVYEGHEGPTPACPASVVGVTEAVQVEPLDIATRFETGAEPRAETVNGQAALLGTDTAVTQRLTAAFPAAGVLVTVSFGGDRATAQRILDSFTPADTGRSTATGRSTSSAASTPHPTAQGRIALSGPAPSGSGRAAQVAVGPSPWGGLGFDACAAPSESTMAAWRASSPYRSIGVYIGGVNRACGDGWLSSSWVSTEVAAGWGLIPLYVGPQAACADQGGLAPISSRRPVTQAIAAADDAAAAARSLGMGDGSPIFYDMEAWNTGNAACDRNVVTYVTAWDNELSRDGFSPAIYGSTGSGIGQDIAPLIGRPGAPAEVDVADWDGVAGTAVPGLPADAWPDGQRLKQFDGNVYRVYGGVGIAIDEDYANASLVGDQQPSVAALRPATASVGTTVTISGEGFVQGRTAVSFGGVAAAGVTVLTPAELTARVPARPLATLDVTVTTPAGSSATTTGDRFTYVPLVTLAADPVTGSYWVGAAHGRVFGFPTPTAATTLLPSGAAPIVASAADPLTGGYRLAAADGTVYDYGAPVESSPSTSRLPAPVVGMAADATTGGYWLVTSRGNVRGYGAPWLGSTARIALSSPIVGMAADPATGGYRLAAADGAVFAFDAPGAVADPGVAPVSPVVGIADDPASGGYWLAHADGTVTAYDAPTYSGPPPPLVAPVVGITATATGYLLATAAGNVYNHHTPWLGSPAHPPTVPAAT